MAALARADEAEAASLARAWLQEFDEAPQQEALHHRLAWKWLRRGAPARRDLERLAADVSLKELPVLRRIVLEFRFMPVVERCQEADHSIVHRQIAHRKTNGPYVSCALRMVEVEMLFQDKTRYPEFLKVFERIGHVDDVAKLMGLAKHPLWESVVAQGSSRSKRQQALEAIMYALDAESQYASMTNVRAKAKKRRVSIAGRLMLGRRKLGRRSL